MKKNQYIFTKPEILWVRLEEGTKAYLKDRGISRGVNMSEITRQIIMAQVEKWQAEEQEK